MINKLHLAMIELYSGDAKRIQHFCKVHSYAKIIAETENVDEKCLFILEAAALTHDIGIHLCEEKYGDCNGKLQEKEGPALAKKLLEELGFDCDVSERVQYLIAHHHTYDNIDGIDYQILVEADFLVNIMEDGLSKEAALNVYHRIFKTECGKKICKEMFDICQSEIAELMKHWSLLLLKHRRQTARFQFKHNDNFMYQKFQWEIEKEQC